VTLDKAKAMKGQNRWNELYDVEHPPLVGFAEGELQKIYDASSFGVWSNYGKLRRVLLHRPCEDVNVVHENPTWWLWNGVPDLPRLQEEWDAFADLLRSRGVKVEVLERGYPGRAKNYFMRDPATMTPWGAFVSRMGLTQRWGEEYVVAKKLWELDIPVLLMITGDGIFEGGNYIPLDRGTVVLGSGIRANDSGILQVQNLLWLMGIDTIVIDVPAYLERFGGYVHADVCFNPIREDLALVYPEGLPYWFLNELRDRGFDLIDVSREEMLHMGTNVLPLDPSTLIIAEGNPEVTSRLRELGFEVIETKFDELMKGGGGPRCVTMELRRD